MLSPKDGKGMMVVLTVIVPLDCDPNMIDPKQYLFGRDRKGKVRTLTAVVDSVLDTNYNFGQ